MFSYDHAKVAFVDSPSALAECGHASSALTECPHTSSSLVIETFVEGK